VSQQCPRLHGAMRIRVAGKKKIVFKKNVKKWEEHIIDCDKNAIFCCNQNDCKKMVIKDVACNIFICMNYVVIGVVPLFVLYYQSRVFFLYYISLHINDQCLLQNIFRLSVCRIGYI
jgi:hypothetical protein